MKRFEIAFSQWVIKNRWLVIALSIAIALSAALGGKNLRFVNDSRIFFSKDNPQLNALEALEDTYTKNQNVLMLLAPKDGKVFTQKALEAVVELTEASWQIPYSNRVDSLSNFQYTWSDADDLIVEDLVLDPASLSQQRLEDIKKIALQEPMLLNRLISPSAHATGINVNILKPEKNMSEVREVATFVRNLITDMESRYPEIDFYLTGGIIIDNAFGEASEQDMKTLVPIMYLVLLIIMGLTLRSFSGTFATFIIIAISMLTGLGLAGWFGINMTPASASAPTIILTLAVADSIHILVTMFQQMRMGKDKITAIGESLRINLQPVFLTSLTTAIGFLTMNFSDAPPFRDLGNIVAMGIIAALFYSVFFLPALMAVIPVRVKAKNKKTLNNFTWLAELVINNRKSLFWYSLAVLLFLSSGIAKINLNDNFIKYFDQRYDFRLHTDFAEENLTGFDIIEYSLDSGFAGGINSPAYLNKVEEFSNWYREQENVVHVNTITDTMKRLNKNMHADDPAYYRIPDQQDLAAQYLLLYQMSLPFGLDLNNQINVDKSATRLIVTLRNVSARDIRAMDSKARDWLAANAPDTMFTYGSGLSVMFAHISQRNIESMLSASVLALVLISLILIFALKSFKLGFLSLLPNLSPAFMSFGVWGYAVGEVGLALSVQIAMTLGIVVDDTIHFISKYQRARTEHKMKPDDAVRYSFRTVGMALWATTFILIAGFIVLSFSGFKINENMGSMTAITISLALALDFIFLPILLMKVEENDSNEPNDLISDDTTIPVTADLDGSNS